MSERDGAVPFAAELVVAREAAALAAAILVSRSGADRVREKARADLVTPVDEAAERAAVAHIHAHFPDDPVVAEEFSAATRPRDRGWILDPLDGTVNYVHRHPFTCVSVAFVDAEGPAVGVINAPFLDETFHAVRRRGAFLNDQPIRVSATRDGAAGLYATGFPFKEGKGDPEVYFDLVAEIVASSHGVRRAGAAALDLAYVACGRLDAFFEIGLSPWDLAAGLIIVAEAGGRVSGWPGDATTPLQTGRLLASNGGTHDWMLDRLARYAPPL